MSTTSRHAFQSPSISDEKGAYRMRPPHSSRPGSNLRHSTGASSRVYLHVPHRRTRRLATLVVSLACVNASQRAISQGPDVPPAALHAAHRDLTTLYQLDITLDTLDEPDTHLNALRANATTTYLAYLPHSGLHNQRIALENALTLARLLNRTLVVPPARLGPKTLRYVRSSTLSRMLRLSDKRQGRSHCTRIPAQVPQPDECVDYMSYTLVPWAWLVDLGPIAAQQALVRVSNGTAAWVEKWLGVRPNETLSLPDTDPYEYQFVDTPVPAREGDKYLHSIPIDTLAVAPHRLIQFGTLFGSSRLRLRKAENREVRGEVRRHMVFANAALTLAVERIGKVLGGTYMGAHVRVGDGRFQKGARANVRLVWWKLVRDVLGLDTQMALGLERHMLTRTAVAESDDQSSGDEVGDEVGDAVNVNEMAGPPEIPADMPSLRVPHPPLPPLPDTFFPALRCRSRLHTTSSLRVLNVPLFVATDAPDGLDDPLLAPLTRTFPCTFTLRSFGAEMAHLEELWNGYDGVRLAGYLSPIVDALVMGGAWAVVGTEGSTFSQYVGDVLWRVSHGWEIVQRG